LKCDIPPVLEIKGANIAIVFHFEKRRTKIMLAAGDIQDDMATEHFAFPAMPVVAPA